MIRRVLASVATLVAATFHSPASGAPYASGVAVNGTDVSFVLNEPADWLGYQINGGPLTPLDSSARGTKTFSLNAATDAFSIVAKKTESVGYTIPTGGVIAGGSMGLSRAMPEAGYRLVSDPANPLTRYNVPCAVAVNTNPNSPLFGTVYVGNSTPANLPAGEGLPARNLIGGGLYATRADGSDAFGYGDVAMNPQLPNSNLPAFATGDVTSNPFTLFIAEDDQLYGSDWTYSGGNLYAVDPRLTSATNVFSGFAWRGPRPTNPSSISSSYVEGSIAAGNLIVYARNEEMPTGSNGEFRSDNNLWRYEIDGGEVTSNVLPTRVNKEHIVGGYVRTDLDRGIDGKFYLSQWSGPSCLVILDAEGNTIYRSRDSSPPGPGALVDLLRNVNGIAVSPDQRWLAAMLRNSDVAVMPLVDGLPDLKRLMVVNTGPNVQNGRDVAFDAAGNLHFTSSGRGSYGVIAPGGATIATTSFDGTSFSFSVANVPEPGSFCLLVVCIAGMLGLRGRG
jgi:hypothetical protein